MLLFFYERGLLGHIRRRFLRYLRISEMVTHHSLSPSIIQSITVDYSIASFVVQLKAWCYQYFVWISLNLFKINVGTIDVDYGGIFM